MGIGGFNSCEKYEFFDWDDSQLNGEIKFMFQTINQVVIPKGYSIFMRTWSPRLALRLHKTNVVHGFVARGTGHIDLVVLEPLEMRDFLSSYGNRWPIDGL